LRSKFDEKTKQKKKRKKRNKKSALKIKLGAESDYDDMQSAYTGYTSNRDDGIDEKDRIVEDYFPHQGKPRDFFLTRFDNDKAMTTITPALTLLEIDDYDEIKMAERLYVNVREAMA